MLEPFIFGALNTMLNNVPILLAEDDENDIFFDATGFCPGRDP